MRYYIRISYNSGIDEGLEQYTKQFSNTEQDLYLNEFGAVYLVNLNCAENNKALFLVKSYAEAFILPIPFIAKVLPLWFGYDKDRTSELWHYMNNIMPIAWDYSRSDFLSFTSIVFKFFMYYYLYHFSYTIIMKCSKTSQVSAVNFSESTP